MRVVIAGGGIIGLAAAILLKKNNHQVTLIEKSKRLGGLLNSMQMNDNQFLDFGTHVPRETGIEQLDEILFANLPSDKWNKYNYANVGNYFGGQLNIESQFIDVSQLQPLEYVTGIKDLLNIDEQPTTYKNELESLNGQFGFTFSENVYKPLLNKLFGVNDLKDLMPNSHNLFGYSRLILSEQNMTEKLKSVNYLDNRIAHTKNSIGASNKKNYYPKVSGIFQWIQHLEKQAVDLGISILKEESIKKIHIEANTLQLNSGNKILFDNIIWTLPKDFLEIAMNVKDSFETKHYRGVHLIHFKYKGILNSPNHYIYCNDPNMNTFRVTLYDNLTQNNINWCTVEIIGNKAPEIQTIFNELLRMQIFKDGAKCIQTEDIYIKNGFPIPYLEEKSLNCLDSHTNIVLLNKDANNFFMEDLLIKMYNKLQSENLI